MLHFVFNMLSKKIFKKNFLTSNQIVKSISTLHKKHSFEQLQNIISKQFKIILKFSTSSSSSSSSSKISIKMRKIVKRKSKKFFNMNVMIQNFDDFIISKIDENIIQIINKSIKYLIQNLNTNFFFLVFSLSFSHIFNTINIKI